MKQIRTSFNMIGVIALLALMAGCATTTSPQNKANMLVAAGFKTITPKTAAQQQKLQQLQTGQVARSKKGRTYYIVADPLRTWSMWVDRHKYQAYQQMRAQHQLAQENLQTAEMYQDAAMQWGAWGGWGMGWGPNGLWGRGRTDRWRWAVLEAQDCLNFMSHHLIQLFLSTHQNQTNNKQNKMKRNLIITACRCL